MSVEFSCTFLLRSLSHSLSLILFLCHTLYLPHGSIFHSKCVLRIESMPMKHKIKGNHRSITKIYLLHRNCFYILWRTRCTTEWHRWRQHHHQLRGDVAAIAEPQKYHQHCLCNICHLACAAQGTKVEWYIAMASEFSRARTLYQIFSKNSTQTLCQCRTHNIRTQLV